MSKDIMKKDLEILLTATKLVSPAGELELDSSTKLTLFNALKPIIMRKHKIAINERMLQMASEAQKDLVEEIADKAAESMVADAAIAIAAEPKKR